MSPTKAEKVVNLLAIQVPHVKTQSSSIGVRNRTTKVPVMITALPLSQLPVDYRFV